MVSASNGVHILVHSIEDAQNFEEMTKMLTITHFTTLGMTNSLLSSRELKAVPSLPSHDTIQHVSALSSQSRPILHPKPKRQFHSIFYSHR